MRAISIFLLSLTLIAANGQRIDALHYFEKKEYDSALLKIEIALEKESKNTEFILFKAEILSYLNEIDEAIEQYQDGINLEEIKSNPSSHLLAKAYSDLAWCVGYKGNFAAALQYEKKSLNHSIQVPDYELYVTSLSNIGSYNVRLGNYDSAFHYYSLLKDQEFIQEDSLEKSTQYNNLAFVAQEMKQYTDALSLYSQSLEYLDSAKNAGSWAIRLNNLGMTYFQMGELNKAQNYIQRSLFIHQHFGDSIMVAKRQANLGLVYEKQENFDMAIEYFEKGIKYLPNNSAYTFSIMNDYGRILISSGNQKKAEDVLKKNFENSSGNNQLKEAAESLQLLTRLYEERKDFTNAYRVQKQFIELSDSINLSGYLAKVKDLEIEYLTEKNQKEKEVLILSGQLEKERLERRLMNQIFISIGVLFVLTCSVIILYNQRKKQKLKNEILAAELENIQNRLDAILDGNTDNLELKREEINQKIDHPLSDREFEILMQILENKSNKEIAEATFVSVNTVKFHLKNIYTKLGVSNRNEALRSIID